MTREEFNSKLQEFAGDIIGVVVDDTTYFSLVDLAKALEVCPIHLGGLLHECAVPTRITGENDIKVGIMVVPLQALYYAIWNVDSPITWSWREAWASVPTDESTPLWENLIT